MFVWRMVSQGQTGFVLRTNWLPLGKMRREPGFVPGTVRGRPKGNRSRKFRVCLCAFLFPDFRAPSSAEACLQNLVVGCTPFPLRDSDSTSCVKLQLTILACEKAQHTTKTRQRRPPSLIKLNVMNTRKMSYVKVWLALCGIVRMGGLSRQF